MDIFGKLSGYKTYITAALGVLAVWAALLTGGDVLGHHVADLPEALRFTFEAALAVFIRHGIATSSTPTP